MAEAVTQAHLLAGWVWAAMSNKLPPLKEVLAGLTSSPGVEDLDAEARTQRDVAAWRSWAAERRVQTSARS